MKAEIISAKNIGALNFFLPLCFRSGTKENESNHSKLILQTTSLTRSFFLPKVFFVLVVFIAVGAIYGLLDFKMGSLVAHARVCDTGDTAITLSAGPVLQALYV